MLLGNVCALSAASAATLLALGGVISSTGASKGIYVNKVKRFEALRIFEKHIPTNTHTQP